MMEDVVFQSLLQDARLFEPTGGHRAIEIRHAPHSAGLDEADPVATVAATVTETNLAERDVAAWWRGEHQARHDHQKHDHVKEHDYAPRAPRAPTLSVSTSATAISHVTPQGHTRNTSGGSGGNAGTRHDEQGHSFKILFTPPRMAERNISPLSLSAQTLKEVCEDAGIPGLFVRAVCRHVPLAARFEVLDGGDESDDLDSDGEGETDVDEEDAPSQDLNTSAANDTSKSVPHGRRRLGPGLRRTGLMLRSNLSLTWQYGLAMVHDPSTACTRALVLGLRGDEVDEVLRSVRATLSSSSLAKTARATGTSSGRRPGQKQRLPVLVLAPALLPCLIMDRALDHLGTNAEERRKGLINICYETGLQGFQHQGGSVAKKHSHAGSMVGPGSGGEGRREKTPAAAVAANAFAFLDEEEEELDLDVLMQKLTSLADACAGMAAVCGMQFRFIDAIGEFQLEVEAGGGGRYPTRHAPPSRPASPLQHMLAMGQAHASTQAERRRDARRLPRHAPTWSSTVTTNHPHNHDGSGLDASTPRRRRQHRAHSGPTRRTLQHLSFLSQQLHGVESKIAYTRSSTQGQVQTIYNLVGQRDARAQMANAEATRRLAELTRRDSTDMRVIAAVTLIFLPATFTATFFSTSFFNFTPPQPAAPGDAQQQQLVGPVNHVSAWIWLYCIITALLSAAVLGVWWYLSHRNHVRAVAELRRRSSAKAGGGGGGAVGGASSRKGVVWRRKGARGGARGAWQLQTPPNGKAREPGKGTADAAADVSAAETKTTRRIAGAGVMMGADPRAGDIYGVDAPDATAHEQHEDAVVRHFLVAQEPGTAAERVQDIRPYFGGSVADSVYARKLSLVIPFAGPRRVDTADISPTTSRVKWSRDDVAWHGS